MPAQCYLGRELVQNMGYEGKAQAPGAYPLGTGSSPQGQAAAGGGLEQVL